MLLRFLPLLAVCCLLVAGELCAEPAAGEAEVSAVRFKLVRPSAGGVAAWFETDVEVNARPLPGSPAGLLPRVRIVLTLATENAAAGAPHRREYYRASAEAVRGELRLWSVEVSTARAAGSGGEARIRYSPALEATEARRAFSAEAGSGAAENDGILLPQYQTPFAVDYPASTPSCVRRDARG